MSELQNPILPIQVNPIEIDRAIVDLQSKLSFFLPWLTEGYGRAYKNLDVKKGKRLYFPEVYLGKKLDDHRYFNVTPDNTKEGQNFFLVSEEKPLAFKQGHHGYLSYDVAIIFSANLEIINAVLLETDYFQQDLVAQVRDVITRKAIGVPYTTEIRDVKFLFEDVFKGLDISNQTQLEKSELTHFRVNCTMILKEECGALPIDYCAAALALVNTGDLRCSCFIPSQVWTIGNDVDWNCLSPQQLADATTRLCVPIPPPFVNLYSMSFNGINQYLEMNSTPDIDFSNTDPFSFSIYFTYDSATKNSYFLVKIQGGVPFNGYAFYYNPSGGYFEVALRNVNVVNDIVIRAPAALVLGTEYQAAFTYDGSSTAAGVEFYLDSAPLAKSPPIRDNLTGSISTTSPIIVGWAGPGGSYSLFKLNILRLWNIELTPAQIVTDYNLGVPIAPILPLNLVAFCDMGDGAIFGTDVWTFLSGDIENGFQSFNMDFLSRE